MRKQEKKQKANVLPSAFLVCINQSRSNEPKNQGDRAREASQLRAAEASLFN
jgi:hypothetical protein